jgi:hypothetical protein
MFKYFSFILLIFLITGCQLQNPEELPRVPVTIQVADKNGKPIHKQLYYNIECEGDTGKAEIQNATDKKGRIRDQWVPGRECKVHIYSFNKVDTIIAPDKPKTFIIKHDPSKSNKIEGPS